MKAAWRLFEQISTDTKDLIDIPELWPQIRNRNLPRVQYTAREVVSGLQFIAYAQERSMADSNLFAQLLIAHLQRCGVNGSAGYEFERYASPILNTDNILVGATTRLAGRREAWCRSVCGSA